MASAMPSPDATPSVVRAGGAASVVGDQSVEVRRRYDFALLRCRARALSWSHDLCNSCGAGDIVADRRVAAPA